MARRLEAVREHCGVPSLRAFHTKLAVGWKDADAVSYEAVRNYHYDRDAPAAYLARVAKVFGVRLAYLVDDDGPMTEEEQDAIEAEARAEARPSKETLLEHIGDTVTEGFGRDAAIWIRTPGVRQGTIVHTWSALSRSAIGDRIGPNGLGHALGRSLRATLDELGVDLSRGDVSETALTEYVTVACLAIRQLLEEPAPKTKSIRAPGDVSPIAVADSRAPLAEEEGSPNA